MYFNDKRYFTHSLMKKVFMYHLTMVCVDQTGSDKTVKIRHRNNKVVLMNDIKSTTEHNFNYSEQNAHMSVLDLSVDHN
jgi:hypothetical protein